MLSFSPTINSDFVGIEFSRVGNSIEGGLKPAMYIPNFKDKFSESPTTYRIFFLHRYTD